MINLSVSPFFTVIVPCFNASKFIIECLSSAFANELEEFEVILIDDGSTDDSVLLTKLYFAHEITSGRLRIISQLNAGLSGARNTGIAKARGAYLIFLDADDMLHPQALILLKATLKNGADIVEFGHLRFISSQNLVWPKTEAMIGAINTRESAFRDASWYACFRAYKSSIFENLRFPIGRHYEDTMTIPFIYLQAQNIIHITVPLYAYRINSAGITQRLKPTYVRDLAEYFCWLLPLDNKILEPHKIGTLRLMKTLGLMMNDSSLNHFIELARKQLSIDATTNIGWLDSLYWEYPWIFDTYIRLRTLRARLQATNAVFRKFGTLFTHRF